MPPGACCAHPIARAALSPRGSWRALYGHEPRARCCAHARLREPLPGLEAIGTGALLAPALCCPASLPHLGREHLSAPFPPASLPLLPADK